MYPLSRLIDAPTEISSQWFNTSLTPYVSGIAGTLRPELPGHNSLLLTILLAILLLVAFNLTQFHNFFSIQLHDLMSTQKRDNIFTQRTANEARAQIACVLQLCVCQSLIALAAITTTIGRPLPTNQLPPLICALLTITVGYYLWQMATYGLIGYIFASRTITTRWLQGFNASQVLLATALTLPAIATLFYPNAIKAITIISIVLYISIRILFIRKGFRIFYINFNSLLYFILYLCAVEFVPLIIIARIANYWLPLLI